jgi:transcriptional regulator with XRE-family HTH domain
MNIGRSIKIAVAKRGIKQKDLAEQMGVTPSSISQLASQASCTGDTLARLAAAFNMKVSDFIALGEE